MTDVGRMNLIMKNLRDHYWEAESLGHEIVGIFVQGSQNYGLDEYSSEYISDIDTKCIVLPTVDDIVNGKAPCSHTHVRNNGEQIDIKDIRVMVDMFKKQNTAYVEILFTDFVIINTKYYDLWQKITKYRERIARLNVNQALRCFAGISLQKYKALEHPYPTVLDKIEKYGYDPKQLHHIVRINEMVRKYVAGKPYTECLIPDRKEQLMAIKKGVLSLEEARELAFTTDQATNELKNANVTKPEVVDKEIIQLLDGIKGRLIKRFLYNQLKQEFGSI